MYSNEDLKDRCRSCVTVLSRSNSIVAATIIALNKSHCQLKLSENHSICCLSTDRQSHTHVHTVSVTTNSTHFCVAKYSDTVMALYIDDDSFRLYTQNNQSASRFDRLFFFSHFHFHNISIKPNLLNTWWETFK